jgi:hypothetical protein
MEPDNTAQGGDDCFFRDNETGEVDEIRRILCGEIHRMWDEIEASRPEDEFSVPPNAVVIEECDDVDLGMALCIGPPRRSWRLDSGGMRLAESHAAPRSTTAHADRGSHRSEVKVRFCISPLRDRVIFNCILGSAYGKGWIWRVDEEGRETRFYPPSRPKWRV